MVSWSASALLVFFGLSCAYITKDEFKDQWDADGDGWPADEGDCNDNDADINPGAPDRRGDGCDADCGTTLDSDNDDWPDDNDCEPDNPDAYPCAVEDEDDTAIDYDCDGDPKTSRTDICNTDPPGLNGADAPTISAEDCGL